jgi:Methyltransferase domain
MTMDRIALAQAIIDTISGETYLEIGVNTGTSFIPIKVHRKWGVDPEYHLTRRRRMKYRVWSLLGKKEERLFRVTSDEFFVQRHKMLNLHGVDVCLVDGLHTYEQALRDVLNTLRYLKPNGVVLLHDCNPSSELMARPASRIEDLMSQEVPGWDGSWSGDVWKTIVHLRALHNDLEVFVLDCDTGIGVVRKGRPESLLPYTESDIRSMDYAVLSRHRRELLGLRPSECITEFLQSHLQIADVAD